jgi:hypothetical protein
VESINKSALAIQLVSTLVQCVCWYLIGRADGKKKALKDRDAITK